MLFLYKLINLHFNIFLIFIISRIDCKYIKNTVSDVDKQNLQMVKKIDGILLKV